MEEMDIALTKIDSDKIVDLSLEAVSRMTKCPRKDYIVKIICSMTNLAYVRVYNYEQYYLVEILRVNDTYITKVFTYKYVRESL